MPKDAHNKAAEHHESAAKSQKMARVSTLRVVKNRLRLRPIPRLPANIRRWRTVRANRTSKIVLARS